MTEYEKIIRDFLEPNKIKDNVFFRMYIIQALKNALFTDMVESIFF